MKKYVKEYFDKAVAKKREHEKKKAERRSKEGESGTSPTPAIVAGVKKEEESDGDQDMAMSDDDEYEKPKMESATPMTPSDQLLHAEGLKRKRVNDEDPENMKLEDHEATPSKRLKSESPPPPPPPPPPPADGTPPGPIEFSNGRMDDVNQYSYAANGSLRDVESTRVLAEDTSDSLSQRPTSLNNARAVKDDDDDILGNAHAPDTPSDPECDERGGPFGGNGQRQLSDIEVHGTA